MLRIRSSYFSSYDATAFKSWLETNNVIVYYILNTPTYTIITDTELVEQLDRLYNDAVTYDNVTNIMQSNTGLPVTFDIEYLQPLDFSRNGLGFLNNVISAKITEELNGDYSKLYQILINVMSNAARFTEVGKISFTLASTKKENQEIAKTGSAISAEPVADRITYCGNGPGNPGFPAFGDCRKLPRGSLPRRSRHCSYRPHDCLHPGRKPSRG